VLARNCSSKCLKGQRKYPKWNVFWFASLCRCRAPSRPDRPVTGPGALISRNRVKKCRSEKTD